MTTSVGRDLRPDDVRIVAAKAMRLRDNDIINVIDPTKSYNPTYANANATCVITKRSIDARGDLKCVWKIAGYLSWRDKYEPYQLPEYQDVHSAPGVIVVGAGPAGMFAALRLLMNGLRPIILERGKDVRARKFDMAALVREGVVNPDSNYCYGEGGAGAFSDGKLYTRSSKRGDNREVLYQLVNFGANPSILIDSHPHLGTDKLPRICENIRECIISHGGEYHFGARVTDIRRDGDGMLHVKAESGAEFCAQAVILATGHSAKDVYRMAQDNGWSLEAQGFAMGVRVEHPQALINKIRYHGQTAPGLPPAEYEFAMQVALEHHAEMAVQADEDEGTEEFDQVREQADALEAEVIADERGVHSFCMCPGGVLVPSATEPETIVMNGMSNSSRSGRFANAGVVVQIEPGDVPEEYASAGAFAGLEFQHDLEKAMYDYASSHGGVHPMAAPAQRMIDFCEGRVSADMPETSYKPGVVSAPLHELFPRFIAGRLQQAFPLVPWRGYYTNEALLVGIESRTSSPIRIVRDSDTLQSREVPGLYPCGEGAGYSGGIVSSAIDGIRCANAASEAILHPESVQAAPVEDDGGADAAVADADPATDAAE